MVLVGRGQAQPVINTVAGSGRSLRGLGGPATGVGLGRPYALAFDPQDSLYITDLTFNQVVRVSPAGTLTLFAGTGVFGYVGDSGPAAQAQFAYPVGITFDGSGNAYVADNENGVVRKIAT